jgi:hypothetical protein
MSIVNFTISSDPIRQTEGNDFSFTFQAGTGTPRSYQYIAHDPGSYYLIPSTAGIVIPNEHNFGVLSAGQIRTLNLSVDWSKVPLSSNEFYQPFQINYTGGALGANFHLIRDTSLTGVNVFPHMDTGTFEYASYFNTRIGDVILIKAKDFEPQNPSQRNSAWIALTDNVVFARNSTDEPFSAYENAAWQTRLDAYGSCSSNQNGLILESEWDYVWISFQGGGESIIQVSHEGKYKNLVFFASGGPVLSANWIAESALTAENPSFLQFRHDMRDAIYEAIDQQVREEVGKEVSRYLRFNTEDDLANFDLLLAPNTERTNRIDSYIKQIEYNTESAINALGESEVKAVYSSLYAKLKEWDSNLGNLIDNTLAKTVENYEKSEELLATLENKAKEETLVQYSITISEFPIERMEIWLYSQYNESYWNINQYASIRNQQLFIELPPIFEITGIETIDKFVPWYIHIWPKRESIENYQTSDNKRFIFDTNKDITDVLWSTIYDINGLSYKIVNYINTVEGYVWILDKNIDSNAIGNPLTIYYNYFDPQVIKMDISWLHNYIPKDIPLGSLYEPITEPVVEEIIETNITQETVIPSKQKEYNKEIF